MVKVKSDIASIMFVIILLFVAAVVFLFMNHLNNEIYTEIISAVNDTEGGVTNYSEAIDVMVEVNTIDNLIWDYAFLGIFVGSLIAMGLMFYAIRISPIFYWLFVLIGLVFLAMGVICSNIWQELAADDAFSTTITRFPITNAILGSYFPMIITFLLIIAFGVLFGKPPGERPY